MLLTQYECDPGDLGDLGDPGKKPPAARVTIGNLDRMS